MLQNNVEYSCIIFFYKPEKVWYSEYLKKLFLNLQLNTIYPQVYDTVTSFYNNLLNFYK